MNTILRLGRVRSHKGSAIIFVAVTLMVLVAFAGLAIDVGYLYVVRGELQNAADSGALAGAQQLYRHHHIPLHGERPLRRGRARFCSAEL